MQPLSATFLTHFRPSRYHQPMLNKDAVSSSKKDPHGIIGRQSVHSSGMMANSGRSSSIRFSHGINEHVFETGLKINILELLKEMIIEVELIP